MTAATAVRTFTAAVSSSPSQRRVDGRFVHRAGERFYVIENAELMAPFFTCIVSGADHWLFASSNGCLTAGRQNSQRALFPYVTEDKIHDNVTSAGPYTALLVRTPRGRDLWEPFRESAELSYEIVRNVYKNQVGDKLGFEEINHTLGLGIYYEWCTSELYGFVRRVELHRLEGADGRTIEVDVLDGLLNVLPACVDEQMQLGFSCLLDAYKISEQIGPGGFATFALASQIVDRAEPREALRATVAYGLGQKGAKVLLCPKQVGAFLRGKTVVDERSVRGRRGAYLTVTKLSLEPGDHRRWKIVADVERTQVEVTCLAAAFADPASLDAAIDRDIERGTEALRAIVADTDGVQVSADEATTAHHFANTLFNDMRGGIYADGYRVERERFISHVKVANRHAFERHSPFLRDLPEMLNHADLLQLVRAVRDPILERLSLEYLPLTFSRRHGDPSRPWNKFDIKVRDGEGNQLLGFQGNWRDIFQNWEALCVTYPEYVEGIIAKFVNASTLDGYNPYRITESGIDWEVPEPENPWAGIGYWGDHQIVYLLKLLELSRSHHPAKLGEVLLEPIFTYADVPYRIKDYESVKKNPRETIEFEYEKNERAEERVRSLGADGKLLFRATSDGTLDIVRVTLLEKLLVASLSKMGNYIPGGGIWLNTQRPEWNDANNALVGYGVSMVTLYYLTRFFHYLEDLVPALEDREMLLSPEVATWMRQTADALSASAIPDGNSVDERERFELVERLGRVSSSYRRGVYERGLSEPISVSARDVRSYIDACRRHLTHSVRLGRRENGLYHAYNLLHFEKDGRLIIEPLYEMLEGQVAALSAGALAPSEVIRLLAQLRSSEMYREDQDSYMLYPNRRLPGFLEKNVIPEHLLQSSSLLSELVDSRSPIVSRDAGGMVRFGADLFNAERLEQALRRDVSDSVDQEAIVEALEVYERVFDHHSFTGRSGTMFGYEGLGSIYWHMVAKLLLAVQENYFWAEERGAGSDELRELGRRYYEIRAGLGGFNKTPEVYGAFVVDPYSHTPENSGARQPGMTGQVKEEVITRFGELGVRVRGGRVRFEPSLLRASEFLAEPAFVEFPSASDECRRLEVPAGALAFTYGKVPVVLHLSEERKLRIETVCGETREIDGCELSRELSASLFERRGEVLRIDVWTPVGMSDL